MKKILMLFAAAALVLGAASCQKENFQKALAEGQEQIDYSDDPMGTIKVYIKKDDTKMDFTETDGTLSRKWKAEDVIDGTSVKDGKYKAFQYTVMEAEYNVEKPYIVLAKTGGDKGVPSAAEGTKIHFVYAQGAVVSFNEENGTCTLDLSNQDEAHIPAVAVASGDVTFEEEDGKPHLKLDFTPVAAVLAIKASPSLKDFDNSTPMSGTFDKVSVSALTRGTMEIEGGKFVLKSVEEGTAIVTGVDGTKDIFAAVLPGSCTIKAKILDVMDGDTRIGSFGYEKSGVTVAADKYLRIQNNKDFKRIPVATIETTNYATVDAAVADANKATEDVTIKMLEDVTIPSGVTIDNAAKKVTTLDLNGCTIKLEGTSVNVITTKTELIVNDAENKGGIKALRCALRANPGVLTINGGTFEGSGYNSGGSGVVYSSGDGSKLTINGGIIKCISPDNDEEEGRAINVTKDSFINGGTIICEGNGFALRQYTAGTCTIDGENVVFYSNSESHAPVASVSKTTVVVFKEGFAYSDSNMPVFEKHEDAPESAIQVSGGHFNKEVVATSGYECIESGTTGPDEREYTYAVVKSAVHTVSVKVGEETQEYTSLSEAITAANNADAESIIVKLLDNVASAALAVNNAKAKKVTIDLAGKTVDAQIRAYTDLEITDTEGNGIIQAAESTVKIGQENDGVNASFILNGGTIKALTGDYAISADGTNNGNQPTVLIKKGNLVAENGNATRTRYASMTFGDETEGDISVNSKLGLWVSYTTDVVINKGVFVSTDRIMYLGNNSSGATFNGGTFTTEGSGFAYNSTSTNPNPSLNILGGFFTWDENKVFVHQANNNAKVSGGYFSNIIPDFCVAAGYICKESSTYANYPYEVVVNEDNSIVKVGTDKFETIAGAVEAINAATSDVEVQFLQNVNLDREIVINNAQAKIVIDLNGKTIKAKNASNTSAFVVEGAATVVDFVDNAGGGIIDHTYGGTGYTLTVKSGTVNLISANISNMTGTGYGRNAIRVLAENAPAYFNMTGGVVKGGRAFRIGGASATAKAYVTISGGFVEGRNTDDTKYYSAISLEAGYSEVLINGGTIKGNGAKSVIYCNGEYADTSTIIINKNEVTNTIPYLYSNGCQYVVAAGGSADKGKLVYSGSWNYYTNKTANSWTGSTLTKEVLDPKIQDEYGYEYTHRCYKNVN